MTKYKKIGIILILIGICTPLISFVFASGYNPQLGFWWSVTRMNINLWQETVNAPETEHRDIFDRLAPERQKGFVPVEDLPDELKPKTIDVTVRLPYKYPFSLGIILILGGFGLFALSKPEIHRGQKE
jgi:hypothetical protein